MRAIRSTTPLEAKRSGNTEDDEKPEDLGSIPDGDKTFLVSSLRRLLGESSIGQHLAISNAHIDLSSLNLDLSGSIACPNRTSIVHLEAPSVPAIESPLVDWAPWAVCIGHA